MKKLDYDAMIQEALRGVVRKSLALVAKEGLPGSHHFYITFRTDRQSVKMPEHLRQKHPDEVTIVLQHQFWDLEVSEKGFSVSLSFNGAQESLYIPFTALVSFMDPSVKFGLQFIPEEEDDLPTSSEVSETSKGVKAPKEGNIITLDTFRKKK